MRDVRWLVAALVLLFFVRVAPAQIFEDRDIGGKTVLCMHSGLFSDRKDCGGNTNWYSYVFVGSISAIHPADNDEKQIQVTPEEVFYGTPEAPLTLLTNQGLCLPPLNVGDHWLFFLRKERDKPITLDYYANDSRPVADAQDQIEILRHLQSIGDLALLRGTVKRGDSLSEENVPNATVIARRKSDGAQFWVAANAEGKYEFQPLPPGDYELTATPVAGYQPDESSVDLKGGSCWDLTLKRSPHGVIGGHVKLLDGSPASNVGVVILSSSNDWYETAATDKNGYFEFDSQSAGEFVVGVNFPPNPDWVGGGGAGEGVKIPAASLFYPGVGSRSNAGIIKLSTDEKREDVDFVIPAQ